LAEDTVSGSREKSIEARLYGFNKELSAASTADCYPPLKLRS
jgi:hypothetical protein